MAAFFVGSGGQAAACEHTAIAAVSEIGQASEQPGSRASLRQSSNSVLMRARTTTHDLMVDQKGRVRQHWAARVVKPSACSTIITHGLGKGTQCTVAPQALACAKRSMTAFADALLGAYSSEMFCVKRAGPASQPGAA